MPSTFSYPVQPSERDRWILSQRPERNAVDARRPYAFLVEEECSAAGEVVPVATVFLTNRECPWRCVMCDLWHNTLTETVPAGAIPEQIDYALSHLGHARQIKLYNSGSFFDPKAIPAEDHAAIADRVRLFERTIVECHPALIGDACLKFRDLLSNQLEVAMGLETVHPEILERLNKRMTLDQFSIAADFLRRNTIDLRVFILVQPPFMRPSESLYWAQRSLDFAFDCGASAATLIPTRGGNGAMEILAREGEFAPPCLEVVESAAEYGVGLKRGRVFVDLWDMRAQPDGCAACHERRVARLREMNLTQQILPRVVCSNRGKPLLSRYDIAIVGSGFAGSLMAMIAKRLGLSVILLERGRHPRFMIGESSTPLSNLLLEDLAARYDLPAIRPLAKWGSWQEQYPELACGLKRGFTFYHHALGQADAPDPGRGNQLLVAASPHDKISDTHWFRAGFDAFLVRQAREIGVDYVDEVQLEKPVVDDTAVTLTGRRDGQSICFRARFVIDATGPRGFMHRALQLPEVTLPGYPSTHALYSHFSGVERLDEIEQTLEVPPYPVDDAAVHHVFDGGWIWVLRFNNGIISAGIAATEEVEKKLRFDDGAVAWERLLELVPTLKRQFLQSTAVRPFTHEPRLSFLSSVVCGDRWALLPSAAGFVDPLLSTGFPLTLLGISRLADMLEHDWDSPRFAVRLRGYSAQTQDELLATSRLIAGLYANMSDFRVFSALTLLYFAAASFSETARRLKKPHLAPSFLLHDHPVFGPACRTLLERAQRIHGEQDIASLIAEIHRVIEPFDVAGLCRQDRRNWFPVDAEDLFRSATKVDATQDEIARLLQSCGFYA